MATKHYINGKLVKLEATPTKGKYIDNFSHKCPECNGLKRHLITNESHSWYKCDCGIVWAVDTLCLIDLGKGCSFPDTKRE